MENAWKIVIDHDHAEAFRDQVSIATMDGSASVALPCGNAPQGQQSPDKWNPSLFFPPFFLAEPPAISL